VGFGIGLHQPDDRTFFNNSTSLDVEFDKGGVGIGYFGYDFDNAFRTEIELGYRRAAVDEFAGPLGIGSQKQLTALGNVLMDIDLGTSITPYLGFGAGLGKTKWRNVGGGGTAVYEGSNSDLTWQAIAGLSTPITDKINLTFDYRYVQSGKTRFEALTAGAPQVERYNPQSHNFMVGLRFNLWEPKPEPVQGAQPAPPPPAPAPAPVAPQLPEKFLVFFDWDKANLTSTAQTIVNDAAAYAAREGSARITATGHADRSGTTAYNLGLSERRAQAVKAELVRRGIADNEIVILWKGEAKNLVPTEDGIREPQNRRVEIVID
jgi:OmpA-OmpF porin, OOP family